MRIHFPVLLVIAALEPIFQPPAEVHSVELAEWRADAGGNGHFYEAVEAPAGITWDDAETYATAHGGSLATITSKEENAFVFKLADDAGFWMDSVHGDSWGPWLGGVKLSNSTKPDEAWVWNGDEGPFTYTNWNRFEPDNNGGHENRLHFYGEGGGNRQPDWDDLAGSERLQGFVVEYKVSPLPQTLGYAALFAVCLTGLLVIATILFMIFRKRQDGNDDMSSTA